MRSKRIPWMMLTILFADPASGGDPPSGKKTPPPLPERNRKVVEFARSRLGESVENGECTRLAGAALRAAGARPPDYAADGDYRWGSLVATYTPKQRPVVEILPGDILQFRDVKVVSTSRIRGGGVRTMTRSYPHHTAVVASADGRSLRVLHQNVSAPGRTEAESKVVFEDPLPLLDLKAGTIWVYRPAAAEGRD